MMDWTGEEETVMVIFNVPEPNGFDIHAIQPPTHMDPR